MTRPRRVPDLLIFLLAAISGWPQPPRIVVDHVSEDDLLSLHVDAKLDLKSKKRINCEAATKEVSGHTRIPV